MQNFIKTIINAVQSWTKKEIKNSTADWNQNDSNADNYVKNRTHWEETVADTLLPETILEFTEAGYSGLQNVGEINLIYGESYYVTWDGNEYLCVCDSFSGEAIGDNSMLMGSTTGNFTAEAPFFILSSGAIIAKEIGTHTFKIEKKKTVVHKIDEKYLPELASTPDWNQNDPDGDGYIENRPFYRVVEDVLLYDGDIEIADNYYNFSNNITVVLGSLYTVIINGVTYKDCTTYWDDYDNCIDVLIDDNTRINITNYSVYVISGTMDGVYNLKIYEQDVETIHQIEAAYMPDSVVRTDIMQQFTEEEQQMARDNVAALHSLAKGRIIYAESVEAPKYSSSPSYKVSLTLYDRSFVRELRSNNNNDSSCFIGTILCIPAMPTITKFSSLSTTGLSINPYGIDGSIYDLNSNPIKFNDRPWTDNTLALFMYTGKNQWTYLPINIAAPYYDVSSKQQHSYGLVRLVDSTTSEEISGCAATPNSVRMVNEIAKNSVTIFGEPITLSSDTWNWHGVVYGNNRFIAHGYNKVGGDTYIPEIVYSTNGIIWSKVVLPDEAKSIGFLDIAYNGSRFVAVGGSDAGSNIGIYSDDGVTWNTMSLPFNAFFKSIAYGNGKFIAVPYTAGTSVAVSEDGINWTSHHAVLQPTQFESIAFGNGKFVATTSGPIKTRASMVISEDGVNWNMITPSTTTVISSFDISYCNDRFIAVKDTPLSLSSTIVYSKDCKNWVEISLPKQSVQLQSAPIYANGQFIMWGYKDSKNILFYSNNGDTWDVITIDVCPGRDHNIAFGDNKFVMVSSEGLCALSTDGLNWTYTHERLYQNDINVTNNVKDIILEDAIIAPVAAEIGQFLVVSEVDKNGKPTKWETLNLNDMITNSSTSYIVSINPTTESDIFTLKIEDNGVMQTYPIRLVQSTRKEESGSATAINQIITQYRFEFEDSNITDEILIDIMNKFTNANNGKFILSYHDCCISNSLSYSDDHNYPGIYINSGHILIRLSLKSGTAEPVSE